MSQNEKETANTSGHSSTAKASDLSEAKRAGGPTTANDSKNVLENAQNSGKEVATKSVQAVGDLTRSAAAGYQSDISTGLHTLAEGLRQTSSKVQDEADDNPLTSVGARYMKDIAEKIDNVSAYAGRKDATELLDDVKNFAKRNPIIFVGGAFALGFGASRLLRSAATATGQTD